MKATMKAKWENGICTLIADGDKVSIKEARVRWEQIDGFTLAICTEEGSNPDNAIGFLADKLAWLGPMAPNDEKIIDLGNIDGTFRKINGEWVKR